MRFDVELFGERLKKLRTNMGLTIGQLGKALDVNGATISKWENGIIKPSVDSVFEITVFFNIPADYILGIKDFELPPRQSRI